MTVSRRTVLSLSAAAALVPIGDTLAFAAPLHCFVVENGTPGHAGYAVSMLTCRDPGAETAALVRLRTAQNYHRKNFAYHSTDRHKLPYFRAAIDRFAQSSNLAAHTARTDRAVEGRLQRTELRHALYQQLFATLVAGDRSNVVVHLEPRTSDRRETKLTAHLQTALGPNAKIALDGAAHDEVMNFAAVLFGTIKAGQAVGMGAPLSKTKAKMMLATQQALRVPDLRYETLTRTGKFRTGVAVG